MPREGRSITCIPAVKKFAQTAADGQFEHKRRVAAYARVSTDIEEQLSSYAAQVDYYTNYIQSRQDWEFVKVYTEIIIPSLIQRNGIIKKYALAV